MADDTRVDSLIIDIEASTNKADAGLQELASALDVVKKALDGFKTEKLVEIRNALNNFKIDKSASENIRAFGTSLSSLSRAANSLTFRKAEGEVVAFQKRAREMANSIADIYGLSKSNTKELEQDFFDLGRIYNQTGNFDQELQRKISHNVWTGKNTISELGRSYEGIVDIIKAQSQRAGSVKLDFGFKELGDDFKYLQKLMGKGFTFDTLPNQKQNTFDKFMGEFDVSQMNAINDVIRRQGGQVDDLASQYRALAEIVREYNSSTKRGAVLENEYNTSTKNTSELLKEMTADYFKMSNAFGKVDFKDPRQNVVAFTDSLSSVANNIEKINVKSDTGDALKNIGSGFRSIVASVQGLKDVKPEELDRVVTAVKSIGESLSGIGSNNNIQIKVTDKGIASLKAGLEAVKKETEGVANADTNLAEKEHEAADATTRFDSALEETQRKVEESKTARSIPWIENLVSQIREYESIIRNMKSGNELFDREEFDYATFMLPKLKAQLKTYEDTLRGVRKAQEEPTKETGADYYSQRMQALIDKRREYQKIVSDMENGKSGFNITELEEAKQKLQEINNEIEQISNRNQGGNIFSNIATAFSQVKPNSTLTFWATQAQNVSNTFNGLADNIRRVIGLIGVPIKLWGGSIKEEIEGLSKAFVSLRQTVKTQLEKISAFWKRAIRTFTFMLVRKSITQFIKSMNEAVQSLALFSKEMNTPFNDNLSNIIADFKYMARAILGAFEPIINAVRPVLDWIADAVAKLAGNIAQLLASITGQSYWMKAKKNVKDYAEQVDKASKTAKNGLQSFDELNNITTKNDSGEEKTKDALLEWEKMPVDKKYKDLADKIRDIFNKLLAPIKEAWNRAKDYVISGIKYMGDELKKLFADMGRDFLEVWNQESTIKMFENIFLIVGDLARVVGNLAKNFREAWNYAETGKHIFENIRDIFAVLIQHARNVTFYMIEWADSIDFKPLLMAFEEFTKSLVKVADFAGGVFEDAMKEGVLKFIKWYIEEGLPHLFHAFTNIINTFDFNKLRKRLLPFIQSVEKLFENIEKGATSAFEGIGKYIAGFVNSNTFATMLENIQRILNEITASRVQAVLEGIGKAFTDIAIAIGKVLTSEAVVKIFEAIGKYIDERGAEGLAEDIKGLAVAFVGLKAAAVGFGVLASGLSAFATALGLISRLKMMGDLGKIASGMTSVARGVTEVSTAAEGATKVNVFTKALTGMKGAVSSAWSFMTMDIGAMSTGTAIASSLVAGIVAFFAGADIGKQIGAWLFPDDAELYEHYKGITGTLQMIKDAADDLFGGGVGELFNDNANKATWENEFGLSADATGAENYAKVLDTLRQGAYYTAEQLKQLREEYNLNEEQMKNITAANNGVSAVAKGVWTEYDSRTKAILEGEEALKAYNEQLEKTRSEKLASTDVSESTASVETSAETVTTSLENVTTASDTAQMSLEDFGATLRNTMGEDISAEFAALGQNVGEGMAQGMNTYNFNEALATLYTNIKDGVKTVFGMNPHAQNMNEDGENIVRGILDGFTLVDFNTEMQTWWDANIVPWFTSEKWTEVSDGIKIGLQTKWNEVVEMWNTDLETWWSNNVEPWFTNERWKNMLSGIAPAFTSAFKDAANGAIKSLNKVLEGVETTVNESLKGISKLTETANQVGADVTLNVSNVSLARIPQFKMGGFPEDGIFAANHNEIIGTFDNGRTAVANNEQITNGIANAVQAANMQNTFLLNTMVNLMEQWLDKDFSIGDDAIFSSYQRGAARHAKRYGTT